MSKSIPSCKVVLLGESGVGKTSIISRYVTGSFDEKCESTNGASYSRKQVKLPKIKKEILFDIWDTAGQERYRSLTKFFYKDASIAIFVYDITRKESFEEIKNFWYSQLKMYGEGNISKIYFFIFSFIFLVVVIAGNKSDLIENEVVKEEEARNYAKEVGAVFKNTSAFNDVGVNELFEELGMYFVDPNYQNIIQKSGRTKEENFTLKKTKVQEKKKCCSKN